MDRKYTAFISYRHLPLDTAVAEKLHKIIERYRVPRELRKMPKQNKLGIVFRDRDELPLSNDLTQDIYDALDNSAFLIVVCTPDTPKSLWVDREITHFLETHDRNHILTVLAAGTPEESIPPRITHIYGQDGTVIDRREPLCAFVVADQTWKVLRNLRREFQRLVAAILDKPLDAIRQRARAYRWKLAGGLMAIVAAVSLGFAGMLVSKNRQIQNQLWQTLLNESKTLALISQNQLEDGDRLGALESALQALPSPDNDRPYYAPAETALENALYLYEWPKYRAYTTITEFSGFSKLTISDNGRYALGLIGWDRIVCYDLTSQSPVWECPLLDDYALESLSFLEDQGTVLYTSCGGGQFVLDGQTGQLLHSCSVSSRVFPEDFTKDERYVALIDGTQVVFFDTQTGETVCSEDIDRGEYTWSSCGGYSADETTFLMMYTGVFDGDRQLWFAVIDAKTGAILRNVRFETALSESVYHQRVIGLDDDSFFVSFCYEDARYYSRVNGDGEVLEMDGYWLSENTFVQGSLWDRIQLIDGIICIVENGELRTIDPYTCQILSEKTYFGSYAYCQLFADGSVLYKDDNKHLKLYQLSGNGQFQEMNEFVFPWAFSSVYGSVHNSDTFLVQTNDRTTALIVTKQGLLGTEKVKAEALPLTLSGSLVYLPDFCGVYCSSDSDTIYFIDVNTTDTGANDYSHTLYHTATGQTETVDPMDIPEYTGITVYDGPVPDGIGQEVFRSAVSENGALAAFAGIDGTLYLYDLNNKKIQAQVPNAAYICDSITFARNDSILVVGNLGQYSVIDTVSGETVGQFEAGHSPSGHNDYHTQIRESKDGDFLFVCSSIAEFDGAIVETENWTVVHHVEGLVGYLPSLDSLVYVTKDYETVYLQQLPDTDELIDLGNRALSGN